MTHKKKYFACFRFVETPTEIFNKYYEYIDVRRNEFTQENIKFKFLGEIQENLSWWYDKYSKYINHDDPEFRSKIEFHDHSSDVTEVLISFDEHPILRELFFGLCEWFLEIFKISDKESNFDSDNFCIEFRTPLEFLKAATIKQQKKEENNKSSDDGSDLFLEIEKLPWEKISFKKIDRIIVEMWNEGYENEEIANNTGLAKSTITNKVCLLRKEYGSEIIPYHKDIIASGNKIRKQRIRKK